MTCPYCQEEVRKPLIRDGASVFDAHIELDELVISDSVDLVAVRINFCPICGKKIIESGCCTHEPK